MEKTKTMKTETMKETETTGGGPRTKFLGCYGCTCQVPLSLSLYLTQDPATGSPNLTSSYPFPVPCDLETPMCPPANPLPGLVQAVGGPRNLQGLGHPEPLPLVPESSSSQDDSGVLGLPFLPLGMAPQSANILGYTMSLFPYKSTGPFVGLPKATSKPGTNFTF